MAHQTTKLWLRFTLVLLCSTGAFNSTLAQAPGFEKILFPIVTNFEVPGAFGSRWVCKASVLNTSHETVAIDGGSFCFDCRQGATATLEPGMSYSVVPLEGTGGIPGSFLFVERRFDEMLHFSLLARDISRSTATWGTEIPVVRESQFRSDFIELLGVPPSPNNYRYTLRIYSIDSGGGLVNVTVFEQRAFTLPHGPIERDREIGNAYYTMIPPDPRTSFAENFPPYAEVTALPIKSEPGLDVESLRVEVEPIRPPGLRIWAFLTLTNNDTQSVTVISPR
jgi:hypothetical protein